MDPEAYNADLLSAVIEGEFERVRFLAGVERAAARSGNSRDEEMAHAGLVFALSALRRMVPGLPATDRWPTEQKVKALGQEVMS